MTSPVTQAQHEWKEDSKFHLKDGNIIEIQIAVLILSHSMFRIFNHEFGHPEGNTIVGRRHGNAIITRVERASKMIITIRHEDRETVGIENPPLYVFCVIFL